jgi:hypothetical protein
MRTNCLLKSVICLETHGGTVMFHPAGGYEPRRPARNIRVRPGVYKA